jgi:hypothetical protein
LDDGKSRAFLVLLENRVIMEVVMEIMGVVCECGCDYSRVEFKLEDVKMFYDEDEWGWELVDCIICGERKVWIWVMM